MFNNVAASLGFLFLFQIFLTNSAEIAREHLRDMEGGGASPMAMLFAYIGLLGKVVLAAICLLYGYLFSFIGTFMAVAIFHFLSKFTYAISMKISLSANTPLLIVGLIFPLSALAMILMAGVNGYWIYLLYAKL